jgi:uncharacterized OB-fold protein
VSGPLLVSVCRGCGLRVYPPRLVCRRCGSLEWAQEPEASGVVEQVTLLRRRLRPLPDDRPVPLALVRTESGVRVVARTGESVQPGDAVSLSTEDGAAVAG